MPLYEFHCPKCDCCFEVRRSFSQGTDDVTCPNCAGADVRRVFTPVMAFSDRSGGQRLAISGGGCASCAATSCAGCASARRK